MGSGESVEHSRPWRSRGKQLVVAEFSTSHSNFPRRPQIDSLSHRWIDTQSAASANHLRNCSFVEPKKLAYPICHVENTINFSQFIDHREMQTKCGWALWIPKCPKGWSENRFTGKGCPWAQDRRVCRQYFNDCEEGSLRMLHEGTVRQRSYCINGPTQFGHDNTWQGPSIPIVGESTVRQSRLLRL